METFRDQLITQFHLPLQNPVLIFALILLIILLAPIIFRRFRIPGIIGLIIAGVIVGPHGVNLLAKNSAVDLFSTIGILYLMFIAGLELEIKEFKKNSHQSIGFGMLTFFLPLLLGFPACYYVLGYDFTASILLASMFSAHTMIAFPIVSKFGISKNSAVAITVGGTIITDTAVLLVLAVITGSHDGNINGGFWIRILLSMTAFLLIMFILVPYISRWFMIRLEGEKTSHYVYVMAIVFLAAFLSELAGLEPIIGAFVAGLVLNRLIPASSVLMNRIQFVGNALFIPFFLISVGMLIDLSSLFTGWDVLWTALVITVVAIIGKYFAARAAQFIYHFSPAQGLLIFGLSASRVAATMAVALVGYEAGILSKTALEATIILILVSCLVAAIVTEIAAKRIVIAEEKAANGTVAPGFHESILIPVANPKSVEGLLEFAHLISNKYNKHPIRLLSVVGSNVGHENNLNQIRSNLEQQVHSFTPPDSQVEVVVVADQNVPSGINRISRDLDIQTIMLGWPLKDTFTDMIFGQKTEHILESNEKSVMVCRMINPMVTYKRIVLYCPQLSELEKGFDYLLTFVGRLSNELNKPVHLYANAKTRDAVRPVLAEANANLAIKDFDIRKWEYFDLFLKRSSSDDIIFIFAGRKGSVSHHPFMENLVDRITDYCASQMVVLVYPGLDLGDDKYDKYRDFSSEQLTRSMETFERFQRGLGKMIHKAE
jgi:Kef-type K+ transport system membrane component KefB